ncbi:MAG: fibrobacter succinogenes major paralogous domain-containing protein [Sphingomonadales bacterium]
MKKISLILSVVLITVMMVTSCGRSVKNENEKTNKEASNEVSDSKGKVSSNEVSIGKQVWMTENLNVDKFRNGDPIPEAKTDEEGVNAGDNKQPAWCYYDNSLENGDRYGKLYNWYAVNDSRALAPVGWKIPSDEDWSSLEDFLGGWLVAGKKMKFTDLWADNDGETGNGTNESGFSGLPGGSRSQYGSFNNIGKFGGWWSSTENNASWAWDRFLNCSKDHLRRGYFFKEGGFSVRCLKD